MTDRVTRKLMQRGWRRQGLRVRLGLLGGLYTGLVLTIFTFGGGREIFMEKPLSLNHKGQEKRCGNCHYPFEGVRDSRCATTCHTEKYNWALPVDFRVQETGIPYKKGIHYYSDKFTKKDTCLECHPAECHSRDHSIQPASPPPEHGIQCEARNIDNLTLPLPLAESSCKECHSDCERSTRCYHCHMEHLDGLPLPVSRPEEVTPYEYYVPQQPRRMVSRGKLLEIEWTEQTVSNFERTRGRMHEKNCMGCHPNILQRMTPTPDEVDRSMVSRSIFRHDSPGHRQYWHCKECHIYRFPLERDRAENIFTMEACSKRCHYREDCTGCHRFHDPVHQPGERVDWPERLRVYNSLTGGPEE